MASSPSYFKSKISKSGQTFVRVKSVSQQREAMLQQRDKPQTSIHAQLFFTARAQVCVPGHATAVLTSKENLISFDQMSRGVSDSDTDHNIAAAANTKSSVDVDSCVTVRKSVCVQLTGVCAQLCRDVDAGSESGSRQDNDSSGQDARDGQSDSKKANIQADERHRPASSFMRDDAPEVTAQHIRLNFASEVRPVDVTRCPRNDRGLKADVLRGKHEFRCVYMPIHLRWRKVI
jgi:hypothetical protein